MNILIIEDEAPAARKLQALLSECAPTARVVDVLDTIKASVEWLSSHTAPDLIFLDIQLADGKSFEIFEHINIKSPVIFTTAYDEYALQAFQVNSIDYLLKPFDQEKLAKSLEKFNTFTGFDQKNSANIQALVAAVKKAEKAYKERFLVKLGDRLIPVDCADIAYFMADCKLTFMVTKEARRFPVDFSLEELEQMMDPDDFFRANRKFIVRNSSLQKITNHFNGKLKISLEPPVREDVMISRDKAPLFKQWLD